MHLETTREKVQANLIRVKERIERSLELAGRDGERVLLVGVTKYVGPEVARWLFEAGCKNLGESRPQSLWEKASALQDLPVCWHLIGHLQRNKIKKTLPIVQTIHSIDSERLLEQILLDSRGIEMEVNCLLELNITQDSSKTGMSFEQALKVAESWKLHSDDVRRKVRLVGLMGMSSLGVSESQIHAEFERLRIYRDKMESVMGIALPELSMGMSEDFPIAIEHGATMVRLGSVLFE